MGSYNWGFIGFLEGLYGVLQVGGVVINGAIRVAILISNIIKGLITPLITTHEPPSAGDIQRLLLLRGFHRGFYSVYKVLN